MINTLKIFAKLQKIFYIYFFFSFFCFTFAAQKKDRFMATKIFFAI